MLRECAMANKEMTVLIYQTGMGFWLAASDDVVKKEKEKVRRRRRRRMCRKDPPGRRCKIIREVVVKLKECIVLE